MRPEQIEYLLLTHCHFDHTGGAVRLRGETGCQIVAHELDATFLEAGDKRVTVAGWYGVTPEPFNLDIKLKGSKTTLALGERTIEALHAPGHSPGAVLFVTESDGRKVVFAHDVHGPLHPNFLSNRDDYLNSLSLLLSLDADILCEGHFGVYQGRASVRNFIQSYIG